MLSLPAGCLFSEKGYKHQGEVYERIELINVTYLRVFSTTFSTVSHREAAPSIVN
jgi:hypothetical protein